MKTNKIYIMLLLLLPLALQSCLKDDDELFDELTTIRVSEALANYKVVLSSSDNGWAVEYYPESNQSYGGYMYVWKFTTADVTAWFELSSDPTATYESLYQLIADEGPVLSFDTYNKWIHYFAEPNSSRYQGYQGDYEFLFMKLSDDQNTIKLKGKRSGNYIYMTRLTESPEDYITKINAMKAHTSKSYTVTVGSETVSATVSNRNLSFTYTNAEGESETVKKAFCYTTTGLKFYEPVEINGQSVQEFTYGENAFVAVGANVTINL